MIYSEAIFVGICQKTEDQSPINYFLWERALIIMVGTQQGGGRHLVQQQQKGCNLYYSIVSNHS
jgi:hypothetical protein